MLEDRCHVCQQEHQSVMAAVKIKDVVFHAPERFSRQFLSRLAPAVVDSIETHFRERGQDGIQCKILHVFCHVFRRYKFSSRPFQHVCILHAIQTQELKVSP